MKPLFFAGGGGREDTRTEDAFPLRGCAPLRPGQVHVESDRERGTGRAANS